MATGVPISSEPIAAKAKHALRRAAPRTDDALRAATWDAVAIITLADIAGRFAHRGYAA